MELPCFYGSFVSDLSRLFLLCSFGKTFHYNPEEENVQIQRWSGEADGEKERSIFFLLFFLFLRLRSFLTKHTRDGPYGRPLTEKYEGKKRSWCILFKKQGWLYAMQHAHSCQVLPTSLQINDLRLVNIKTTGKRHFFKFLNDWNIHKNKTQTGGMKEQRQTCRRWGSTVESWAAEGQKEADFLAVRWVMDAHVFRRENEKLGIILHHFTLSRDKAVAYNQGGINTTQVQVLPRLFLPVLRLLTPILNLRLLPHLCMDLVSSDWQCSHNCLNKGISF